MALNVIDDVEISCSRTISESQVRGIISGVVVLEENDRVIGASLNDQGLMKAKRITRIVNGVLVPT